MRKAGWLIVAMLLMLGVVSGVQGALNAIRPGGSQDFQWSVARYLLKHENPYQLFRDYKANRFEKNPFRASETPVYPASAEIFLWPVAALKFEDAKLVWATANLLFAVGSAILIARMAGVSGNIVLSLLALFLASTSVRTTIGNGQQGLFSLFFFLLAFHFQQQKKTTLASLCLAASWFKYTITFPLSLIFLKQGRRSILVLACAAHLALTIFLALWIGEHPLRLLLSPLTLAENAVTASMFDLMAISHYIGVSSLIGPALFGIFLFAGSAALIIKSSDDPLFDLSLLSLVSLVWTYHWQYDYIVLIIPLGYALKRWQQASIGIIEVQIIVCTFLIWFVQRALDGALLWLPENASVALAGQIVFWLACLLLYTSLVSYIVIASLRLKRMAKQPQDALAS